MSFYETSNQASFLIFSGMMIGGQVMRPRMPGMVGPGGPTWGHSQVQYTIIANK